MLWSLRGSRDLFGSLGLGHLEKQGGRLEAAECGQERRKVVTTQGPRSLETWLNSGQEVKNRKMVPGSVGQPGSWLARADLEIKAEEAQKRLWEVFIEPDVLKHLLVTLDRGHMVKRAVCAKWLTVGSDGRGPSPPGVMGAEQDPRWGSLGENAPTSDGLKQKVSETAAVGTGPESWCCGLPSDPFYCPHSVLSLGCFHLSLPTQVLPTHAPRPTWSTAIPTPD